MKLWLMLMVVVVSGCATFGDDLDKAAEKVGKGVDRYCSEVSEQGRADFRNKVNPTEGGASIVVTCP